MDFLELIIGDNLIRIDHKLEYIDENLKLSNPELYKKKLYIKYLYRNFISLLYVVQSLDILKQIKELKKLNSINNNNPDLFEKILQSINIDPKDYIKENINGKYTDELYLILINVFLPKLYTFVKSKNDNVKDTLISNATRQNIYKTEKINTYDYAMRYIYYTIGFSKEKKEEKYNNKILDIDRINIELNTFKSKLISMEDIIFLTITDEKEQNEYIDFFVKYISIFLLNDIENTDINKIDVDKIDVDKIKTNNIILTYIEYLVQFVSETILDIYIVSNLMSFTIEYLE